MTEHENKEKPTRWTIVLAAKGEGPEARAALNSICLRFDPVLKADAASLNSAPLDPADLVQDFWLLFMSSELWAKADPKSGRLRDFLFVCFRNFRKRRLQGIFAEKRGVKVTVSIEDLLADPVNSAETTSRGAFDYSWAHGIYCEAIASVRKKWDLEGDLESFNILKHYLMRDIPDATSELLGEKLRVSPLTVRKRASRLAKEIRSAVRSGTAQFLADPSPQALDEEVKYVFDVLANRPPFVT